MRLRSGSRNGAGQSVLVTGAAGFIGSHLNLALLAAGHRVIAVDRLDDAYPRSIKIENLALAADHPSFEFHQLDVADPAMRPLVGRADIVIHLAGRPGVRGSWGSGFEAYVEDNIVATQRLLEASSEARLRKFVFASSSSVYGNGSARPSVETDEPRPVSPYGVTKLAAERLCLAYEEEFATPTASLRFFTVYGPRQRPDMAVARFIDLIGSGHTVPLNGGGAPVRELTYVGDAVQAILAAAFGAVHGRVINVGGGSLVTVRELAEMVADELGRPLTVAPRPAAAGDATRTWCDHRLAKSVLGYEPLTDLRSGIRAQVRASIVHPGSAEVHRSRTSTAVVPESAER